MMSERFGDQQRGLSEEWRVHSAEWIYRLRRSSVLNTQGQ